MATPTCIACDAELDTSGLELGDTITCAECGAEMEVISLRPLELELLDDSVEEDAAEDLEEEEPDEEEEEELAL